MTRTLCRRYSLLFGPDPAAGHRTASRKDPKRPSCRNVPAYRTSTLRSYLGIPNIVRILWQRDCVPRSCMNSAPRSTSARKEPRCGKQIVAIFLRSAKRKLVSLEFRANQLRSGAIREAAHLAAGTDVGLEQSIIDACFRRQLHYDLAHEYADNIARVIEETRE
jgi:hypothetical protein